MYFNGSHSIQGKDLEVVLVAAAIIMAMVVNNQGHIMSNYSESDQSKTPFFPMEQKQRLNATIVSYR